MIVEFLLLFVVSASATVLFYIVFEELNRYKKMRRLQSIFDKTVDSVLIERDKRTKLTILNKLEEKMLLANFNFSPYSLIIFTFSCGLFLGYMLFLYLHHWIGYVMGFCISIVVIYFIMESAISRRSRLFNKALATTISVLVKMMKNGVGFEQALTKSVEVSNCSILKNVFEVYFREKNTTSDLEAFRKMSKYVKSKELNIFAMAVKIGKGSGGKFSNTLEKVEKTITYRKKVQDKIDVFTRESSFGSYIVSGIGIVLYFMINFNFQGRIQKYFMTSPYGRWQLLGIIFWVIIGLVINKLMTRVEK